MDLIKRLEKNLSGSLPGADAHKRMMHGLRHHDHHVPVSAAKKAGVLLLLFPDGDHWHTVFIERKVRVGVDAHSGQISLPGGKYELSDASMAHTAIRETEEEIGVAGEQINLLGSLSKLYIPVSNFQVYPYIGFVEFVPEFSLQDDEVEDIIPVAVDHLKHPATRQTTHLTTTSGMHLRDVPYFNLSGKVLWGATAMIVNEFLEILEDSPVGIR